MQSSACVQLGTGLNPSRQGVCPRRQPEQAASTAGSTGTQPENLFRAKKAKINQFWLTEKLVSTMEEPSRGSKATEKPAWMNVRMSDWMSALMSE